VKGERKEASDQNTTADSVRPLPEPTIVANAGNGSCLAVRQELAHVMGLAAGKQAAFIESPDWIA
jgi:hypothetical protein